MALAFGLGSPLGCSVQSNQARLCRRSVRPGAARRRLRVRASANGDGNGHDNEMDEWFAALEVIFAEALLSYYEGAPLFSDAEFNALRDELEHLSVAQMRLGSMEKVWVQATSSRDFDRRMQKELRISEDEYSALKKAIEKRPGVMRPRRPESPSPASRLLPASKVGNAVKIGSDSRAFGNWLFFGDATEERLKVALLYFPAVLICLVATSLLTILFALLDGEMTVHVSQAGRVRLGILSYLVIMATAWVSNKVTPIMLDFLDLGQPTLLRGACPNCTSPVSCLFTGNGRVRDERKCSVCGAVVGFNRRWAKLYLVAGPGDIAYSKPD